MSVLGAIAHLPACLSLQVIFYTGPKGIVFVFLCRSPSLKILICNNLNNSSDISIPLLFVKTLREYRPRPIQTVISPANYLPASYVQEATVKPIGNSQTTQSNIPYP